jgi:hypothetical protein
MITTGEFLTSRPRKRCEAAAELHPPAEDALVLAGSVAPLRHPTIARLAALAKDVTADRDRPQVG